MKKFLLITIPSLLACAPALAESDTATISAAIEVVDAAEAVPGDSAEAIIEHFEKAKADALGKYLEANPAADDYTDAAFQLTQTLQSLGDHEAALPLLEELLETVGTSDPGTMINGVLMPLIESYRATGAKDKARAAIETAKERFADHPAAANINQFLGGLAGELNAPGIGDTMDIAFTATDGTEVDLSAMQGKVILVDFWATWCGPCIAEMPNVIKAYEAYNEQGFEVIGISLDQDKDALETYIKENNMSWPQYFDGKGWQNELAAQFGIRGIPATFLIGKDGKIVASNLRGNALEEAIKENL